MQQGLISHIGRSTSTPKDARYDVNSGGPGFLCGKNLKRPVYRLCSCPAAPFRRKTAEIELRRSSSRQEGPVVLVPGAVLATWNRTGVCVAIKARVRRAQHKSSVVCRQTEACFRSKAAVSGLLRQSWLVKPNPSHLQMSGSHWSNLAYVWSRAKVTLRAGWSC